MNQGQSKHNKWSEIEAKISKCIDPNAPVFSTPEEFALRRIRVLKQTHSQRPSKTQDKKSKLDLLRSQNRPFSVIQTELAYSSPLKQHLNPPKNVQSSIERDKTMIEADHLIEVSRKLIDTTNEANKNKQAEKGSLFTNSNTMPGINLFSNNANSALFQPKIASANPLPQPLSQNLFGNKPNSQLKPFPSSNSNTEFKPGNSLFTNPKTTEKPTVSQASNNNSSLFSNLNTANPFGLFGANAKIPQNPTIQKEQNSGKNSSLFTNPGNLFAPKANSPFSNQTNPIFSQIPKNQQKPSSTNSHFTDQQQTKPLFVSQNLSQSPFNSLKTDEKNKDNHFMKPIEFQTDNLKKTQTPAFNGIFSNPLKNAEPKPVENKQVPFANSVPQATPSNQINKTNLSPTSSLFSIKPPIAIQKPTTQIQEEQNNPFKKKSNDLQQKTQSLSPLFTIPQGSTLFGNTSNPATNIFAAPKNDIFSMQNKQKPQAKDSNNPFFPSTNKQSLFNNPPSSGLFSNPNRLPLSQPQKAQDKNEQDGQDDQLFQQQPQGEQGEMVYQYKSQLAVVVKFQCELFIRNQEQSIKEVIVSIEKSKANNKNYLFVRLKKTKKTIYRGMLLPVTVCTLMKSNKNNMKLGPVVYAQNVEPNSKPILDTVKLKFVQEKDSEAFELQIKNIK